MTLNEILAKLVEAIEKKAEITINIKFGDHKPPGRKSGPIKMPSKFAGVCAGCGQDYAKGDEIMFVPGEPKGKSVYHTNCKPVLMQ